MTSVTEIVDVSRKQQKYEFSCLSFEIPGKFLKKSNQSPLHGNPLLSLPIHGTSMTLIRNIKQLGKETTCVN